MTDAPSNAFPIVGIGASAGGLEALCRFFSTLPDNSGMGFVVIQHLAPDRESLMPELLARKTSLPIHVAADETLVEPNHIYIIPPNTQLSIDGGFLRVDRPSQIHGFRTPVDKFFKSLAEDQGPFAIGVILSGAGSDGAVGLRFVKEHGGLTIAQSTETAQFSGMPTSAILTGLIDYILPVEAIAEALILYAKYLYDLRDGKGLETLRAEALTHLEVICSHLYRRTGHDFHGYKRNTMGRRVQRRMQILHITSPAQYVRRLREDPEEVDALFKELLIGVTQFFRDPEAFAFFSDTIIPKIVKSKHNNETIRIWIPGCSTGEEVYSLAILFYEYLHREHLNIPLQIFGTDIDERALDIARRGQYPESIQEDVLPDRLSLFFEQDGSCYRVAKVIREVCIFSFHNLVGNPPFSRMDVISCRNLLIYMEPTLQNQMFAVFHYSLNPEGYLFLGASEQAEDQTRFFRPVNKRFRVFQPKEIMRRTFPKFPIQGPRGTMPTPKPAFFPQIQDPFIHTFDQLVREEYGPPGVLIDKECQVQYVSGRTGTYLQLPSGSVNVNLINMVMPDLRMPLRSGILKAVKTGKEVVLPNIQLTVNDDMQSVDIIVRPLFHAKQSSDLLMVVFREKGLIRKPSKDSKKYSKGEHRTIKELEQEIDSTREHLQTALEELETSNQELKSSNQELMSVNEELQSANEELQTSTEELQSINEELETVNAQLSGKLEELDHANSDMENLFRTTNIATLFLNADLCIQKYTPAAQKMFQFLDTDIGRPITQLSSFSRDETLLAGIRDVLRTSRPNEQTHRIFQDPRTFFTRMTPYQSSDGQTQGVVLTFVDISKLRQAEDQVLRFSQQQKVMAEFAQLALQERDVQKVMDECVRLLSQTLPIEMAKVLEILPGERSLLLRAGVGWKEGLVGQAVVSADQNSQAGYTLISQKPVIVKDLSAESRFSGPSLLIDHQVVSGMSCIIRDQAGNPHGVLGVHTTSHREFREKEVEFLQAMANILASAIHRKNIETQLQFVTESLERRVDERTQDLVQHQHRLRQMSLDLILTEQRERRRIATELHDYLGQLLVVGKIKISQLLQTDLSNQQAPLVREMEESLDEALQYTRDLIPQISPPILYEFGFLAAVRWLSEKMKRYDLHVTVASHVDEDQLNLSESVSIILYQAIRELLLNVMKHAQTQEASILINQVSSEVFGVEVADRGCGFDLSSTRETHSPFDKFGLLNVQERIESLGGECEVLSRIGEGTRVLIKVPISVQGADEESLQSSSSPKAVRVSNSRKTEEGIRVVLADDHPIFREGLGTMLNACPDIQVVGEAENGEQAVELVQTLHPDVVVMDINMPVMNGIEATRLIKASHPAVYIIGLSMHGDQIVSNNFAEAGGDEYVSKGDSFGSFAEVIRSSQKNR
ncbi:chemotaxis protein CheB [Candidatus Nitrospira allomarina]|uniref:protein-glutamate O-methyltransferase n=1 Tax=Candidatus Nitrospira allomarina TaxID=3020900 RepID=A0AA96JR19_9BACT|nr:chemotaxis protein CheB [Candidatus Nitrospira allomarina]WNM56668.1 chemotaxis protein CheB [Candidatus Nitrospira allomarina]